ncbi:MAG: methyl-accepting chemotaxis protein [Paraglaciecola sp.]|jgi:methyl-accepting chemotaxis protein
MIKLTLKQKITLSANIAIAIACLLVTMISFMSAKNRLDDEIQSRLKNVTTSYNNYVADWIAAKGAALSAMPSDVEPEQISKHLRQMKNSAQFDNVFMAFPDGSNKNANNVKLPPGNDDPRKWGWYKNAIAEPNSVFMDNPTVAAATGANVVSLGKAQYIDNEQIVIGADVELTDILEQLKNVILPGDSEMFITTKEGKIFAHEKTALLNKSVDINNPDFTTSTLNRLANDNNVSLETLSGIRVYIYVAPIEGTRLNSVVLVNYNSVITPLYDALYGQLLVAFIAIAVCAFLLSLLCRILFIPLKNVSDALALIAQGGGDLTQRINIKTDDEVGQLANNFNTFVGSLQALIKHVRGQAGELEKFARFGANSSDKAVKDLQQQKQEITSVATAVTEMASSTKEIAFHAEQTAKTVHASSAQTESGRSLVINSRASINTLAQEMVQAKEVINELHQHAQAIDGILSTIQGIAEQTNLLALNAAIEAARAGEQGRGFAVVADEVRVLSQRTHSSTEEIQTMINTLQQSTVKAVDLMETSSKFADHAVTDSDKAAASLNEISESVGTINDMTTQIATAAEQQTIVTEEIMKNSTSIQDIAEEISSDAKNSQEQSETLSMQASQLNGKVATFVV